MKTHSCFLSVLRRLLAVAFFRAAVFTPICRADIIADWNRTASDYLNQHGGNGFMRGLAMIHVAQFDAVNAVVAGFTPYALDVSAPGASPEAAAAQAAYTVLTNLNPANVPTLNSALNRSLIAIPDGPAKEQGRELGRFAAGVIIRLRSSDNVDLPITPSVSNLPGKWRYSPPNSAPGSGANARYQLPWTLRSPAQFRAGPPPALTSAEYAADFEEVRLIGARNSTVRTPDQKQAGDFHWAGDQPYLQASRQVRALTLIESARAHALYYMVLADSTIAFYEAQYAYSFWRPYTAIRLADTDGNDDTTPDRSWNPLWDTPNHPEYPSGTCSGTAGQIAVLTHFYGDDFGFTASYVQNGTIYSRTYARLSDVPADAVIGRIASGAHFRSACLAGLEMGRKIAEQALRNFLRPLPRLAGSLGPGEFQLRLGETFPYVIEASADLKHWTPWQTNHYQAVLHTDPDFSASPNRFYRATLAEP
ncbi:MAG TPA: vanadium-dependent haloperoxidase [Verrucomicrobiota bacterium]|nr:hypothetical protein [Verrucomicrobiales bacterium]HRI13816.1 vanadium-dependent haloperoxidase [Verrucomicrobiota bacterium]